MAFFRRKEKYSLQETFSDFIQNESADNTLIWKYPYDKFNDKATLTVPSGQTALLSVDDTILHTFECGTYLLTTSNYPVLSRARLLLYSGVRFKFNVCFIRNNYPITVRWKTETAVSVVDPVRNVPVTFHSHGDLVLNIQDSEAFIGKLKSEINTMDEQEIIRFVSQLVNAHIRSFLPDILLKHHLSLIGIDAHLLDLSREGSNFLADVLQPYGLAIKRFMISEITCPEQTQAVPASPVSLSPGIQAIPAPDKTGHYIFVSYSHRNTDIVIPIIRRMQADGYAVWFDEGIDPGTEWDQFIAEKIENCTFFLSAMSKDYLQSTNCCDETYYAREFNKNRVLVYLEPVSLPPGMHMRLGRLQSIHKYKYHNETQFYEKLYSTYGIDACKKDQSSDAH